MYIPENPSFSKLMWGLRGYTFHGHIFLMIGVFVCSVKVGFASDLFGTRIS